jgi:1-acyl-sn-glycerol-3-phosphate acyltransferase
VRTPILDAFRPAVRGVSRLYFGLDLAGTEHIPASGPVVITPNHQTYADPPLVTIPIRRPVYYMAWDRLFDVPVFCGFIRMLRAFPVQIESSDPRATREAVRLLRAGEALMIFPEGARSPDGGVGRFKPGAFRLAASLGAAVLPVTITGAHESWPPGRTLPRPGRIRITYHPPMRAPAGGDPRQAAIELAERVRDVVVGAMAPAPRAGAMPAAPPQARRSSTR